MVGEDVFTIETPTAIVRIHPGKMTEEEREAALKKATVDFYRAVMKNPQTRSEWPGEEVRDDTCKLQEGNQPAMQGMRGHQSAGLDYETSNQEQARGAVSESKSWFTASELRTLTWWAKEGATALYRKFGSVDETELAETVGRKAASWAKYQEDAEAGLTPREIPEGFTAKELYTVAGWAMDKADAVRNRWDEAGRIQLELARTISRKALALSQDAA